MIEIIYRPEILERLMEYVVNLVLIMQLLFIVHDGGKHKISIFLIERVVDAYKKSDIKKEVNSKIKAYVDSLKGINKMDRDKAFDTVERLLRDYCKDAEILQLEDEVIKDS